jgi:hypothetical protein
MLTFIAGESNNHKGRFRGNPFWSINSAAAAPVCDKDHYRVTGLQMIA